MREENENNVPWLCDKCKKALSLGEVFIGEELALGKMLEVEKGLEDK